MRCQLDTTVNTEPEKGHLLGFSVLLFYILLLCVQTDQFSEHMNCLLKWDSQGYISNHHWTLFPPPPPPPLLLTLSPTCPPVQFHSSPRPHMTSLSVRSAFYCTLDSISPITGSVEPHHTCKRSLMKKLSLALGTVTKKETVNS